MAVLFGWWVVVEASRCLIMRRREESPFRRRDVTREMPHVAELPLHVSVFGHGWVSPVLHHVVLVRLERVVRPTRRLGRLLMVPGGVLIVHWQYTTCEAITAHVNPLYDNVLL